MAQLFHRSTNSVARLSILGGLFLVVSMGATLAELQRSSYVTRQWEAVVQTPPFSNQHHVGGMGIECRYCHTSVETSNFAGIPPTRTCMNCHAQIWTNAPMLEPVRESFRTGRNLVWIRVHDLPDFVYFDHSIHVNKGIGCRSCHGEVDNMPLMWEANSLQMEWCLDCHRNPAKFIRPKTVMEGREEDANGKLINAGVRNDSNIFNMKYQQPSPSNPVYAVVNEKILKFTDQYDMGNVLTKVYHLRSERDITSCNTCHR
jgi:hypothetical protein